MATQTEVLRAAAKRFGEPKSLFIRRNPKALLADERERTISKMKELTGLKDLFAVKSTDFLAARKALQKAAQFVVDVNGDEPSIQQLRDAVNELNRLDESDANSRDYREQRDKLSATISRHRFELCRNLTWCILYIAGADTLDNLLEKVMNTDKRCAV